MPQVLIGKGNSGLCQVVMFRSFCLIDFIGRSHIDEARAAHFHAVLQLDPDCMPL